MDVVVKVVSSFQSAFRLVYQRLNTGVFVGAVWGSEPFGSPLLLPALPQCPPVVEVRRRRGIQAQTCRLEEGIDAGRERDHHGLGCSSFSSTQASQFASSCATTSRLGSPSSTRERTVALLIAARAATGAVAGMEVAPRAGRAARSRRRDQQGRDQSRASP